MSRSSRLLLLALAGLVAARWLPRRRCGEGRLALQAGAEEQSLRAGSGHDLLHAQGQAAARRQAQGRQAAAVDCFYVYPTVSDQQTLLATKAKDPEIRSIALYQAARYSQHCRVFAPVYRQVTLAGLLGGDQGGEIDRDIPYNDVREAWRTYLRKYNKGRGVVLVSHSQGTFVLRRLVAEEIDRKPKARRKLVSAILLGGNVTVKKGRDRGGDFRNVRACRAKRQTVRGGVLDLQRHASGERGVRPHRDERARGALHEPGRARRRLGADHADQPERAVRPWVDDRRGDHDHRRKLPTAKTPWIEIPNAYTRALLARRRGGRAQHRSRARRAGLPPVAGRFVACTWWTRTSRREPGRARQDADRRLRVAPLAAGQAAADARQRAALLRG